MKILSRQILFFGLCGCTAFLVDASLYSVLLSFLATPIAKGCSFITATMVSFSLNKYITFSKHRFCPKEVVRFAILYASTLSLNIGVNQIGISLFEGQLVPAFVLATACSATVNFLGQRGWVFAHSEGQ